MIDTIGGTIVYTSNQRKAVEFYTQKLGFEVKSDMQFGNNVRWMRSMIVLRNQQQLSLEVLFWSRYKVTRGISQFVNYIEGGKSPGDNIVLDVLTNNGARSAAAVALGERQ